MKLTDALLGEHGVLNDMLDELEAIAMSASRAQDLVAAAEPVLAVLLRHATLEDELLFPALEKVPGLAGMSRAMRAEHQLIESMASRFRATSDLATCRRQLAEILATTRIHFAKEEQVCFPASVTGVAESELSALGGHWASSRSVHVA